MTYTIDTIQDLVRVLDEHPQWLDALRARLLPPAVLRLPEQLADLAARVQEVAEQTRRFQAATEQRFDSFEQRFDGLEQRFDGLEQRFDGLEQRFDGLEQRFDGLEQRSDAMEQRLDRQDQRLGRVEVLLGRAIDDLGMLKGARAGDVAGKEAGLIARDVGLHYRRSLTGTELASLSDAVDTTGIAANELRSFHQADLIFEATDREGDLQYVAVEASWTVNGRDTARAIRNAGLLATFTGRRSHAVVAGVRRDDRIRHRVDAGEVFWYELTPESMHAH
ncbi:MAG: hypothetical protein OXQ31_13940 [Spirochaetaceae bacterium]|nr:hypothetical protein [Spirochaetaceae bacterium]